MNQKGFSVASVAIVVAVVALLVGGVALFRGPVERVVQVLGSAGAEHVDRNFFLSGFETSAMSYGHQKLATTTNGAGTLTAAQLCTNDRIVATPNVGAVTVSVASSSAMFDTCIPNPGDVRRILFQNATTAAIAITLADTGVNTDHQEAEGATTLVDGTEYGWLTFMNLDDTTMVFEVEVIQVAD